MAKLRRYAHRNRLAGTAPTYISRDESLRSDVSEEGKHEFEIVALRTKNVRPVCTGAVQTSSRLSECPAMN
jgi:hypothetical protein